MKRPWLSVLGLVIAIAGAVWLYIRIRSSADDHRLELPAREVAELPPPVFSPDDWPGWRGPNHDNRSRAMKGPTEWGEDKNIAWKSPIPGRGHSTPILLGNRIFLTTAEESSQKQIALALDRDSGELVWQTTVHQGSLPSIHPDNSYASGTPATDGERIFVDFANREAIHVTALSLDGQINWTREAGPHGGAGCHGSGASPVVWSNYVFVSDDSPGKGWVAALHRGTGEIAWRKARKTTMGSYGGPTIGELNGKTCLILAGNGKITAYEPTTGNPLWETAGMAEAVANTATVADNRVYSSSGYPQRKLLALNADGSVAWKKENGNEIPYPPSMVVHRGLLFALSDHGFASCFDAATGRQHWKERLPGGCYASPLIVGDLIYACSRDGSTTIFEATTEYAPLATNKLEGAINASPVLAGGRLFIRTDSHLYCIK